MSVKTVATKLQIKPGTSLWMSHPERVEIVGPLPDDARVVADLGQATAALVFADDAGAVRAVLDAHREHLAGPGLLWVAYPKGNRTDINRDSLWPILAEYGCARSARSRWTRPGRRCASARCGRARRSSPAGAERLSISAAAIRRRDVTTV